MKKIFLFHFAFLTLLSSLFGEITDEKEWLAGLGSIEFSKRTSTYDLILAEGEAAVPFLEKLIAGEDPELSLRAVSLLRKIQMGITPETPEKIAQLIETYFQTNRKGRVLVIEELVRAREYRLVLKLRQQEEDEQILNRIDDEIAKAMPMIVARYLEDGEVEQAKEFLLLSDQFSHLIHYASLLDYTGELEEEIVRLRKDTPGAGDARYLACLRVKGDPVLIREEALRLGDQDLANLAAIAMGDHIPLFQSLVEMGDLKLVDRHYLKWSLAEKRGDSQGARQAREAITHLSEQPSERMYGRAALFKMGLGAEVIKNLGERGREQAIEFAVFSQDYGKAQELAGIPDGEKVFTWIEETAKQAREDFDEIDSSASYQSLIIATNFLEGRGLVEEATRCAFALFDLGRNDPNIELSLVATQIKGAPTSALSAIAREIDEFDSDLASFSNANLFPELMSSVIISLDTHLQEIHEKMATRDRLLLMTSFFSSRLLVPVPTYTEARDKLFAKIADSEDPAAELRSLSIFFLARNRAEDLRLLAQAMREEDIPNAYVEAILAADLGNLKEAAELILEVENEQESYSPSYSTYLYLKGCLMLKGGDERGKAALENARRFSNGSAEVLKVFSDQHLRLGEIEVAHALLKKALFRTQPLSGFSFSDSTRSDLVASLGKCAAQLGRWQETLACREVGLYYFRRYSIADDYLSQHSRLQLLVARGAVEMENGNLKKAVRSFTQAHQLLPSDGHFADELFPLLRALGLTELHDQLFAESAEFCRENIRRYPKDDNLYNNFAWQASRANRALDEAEEYLKKGLAMNPESAAYLDTMAEIEFARKNRSEAVKWSEKSLANQAIGSSRGRWELQEQNRRFKTGGFPVE